MGSDRPPKIDARPQHKLSILTIGHICLINVDDLRSLRSRFELSILIIKKENSAPLPSNPRIFFCAILMIINIDEDLITWEPLQDSPQHAVNQNEWHSGALIVKKYCTM